MTYHYQINLIRFSFFKIESNEEEIVFITAGIHFLKKRTFNGNNNEIYVAKTDQHGQNFGWLDAVSED